METQRGHGGQSAGFGGIERGQHFIETEKCFQNQEVRPRVLEQANLFGHEILGMTQGARPFAFDELRA